MDQAKVSPQLQEANKKLLQIRKELQEKRTKQRKKPIAVFLIVAGSFSQRGAAYGPR